MNQPQRQTNGGQVATNDLLEELLDRPLGERHKALDAALTARVPKIEELLPDFMKGQGERLSKRAMMTFQRNPDLQKVPPGDFVRCVLEAAEMGFAIDGKMCYVVNYKGKYQCQLDYKGIVAVARRMKTIADIYSDVVCQNDHFEHARQGSESILNHTYKLGDPRGDVIGAYAVVKRPDGLWRYELMDRTALDKIQHRAPAQNGPWKTDPDEMRKKTVIRRCLKMYGDDPGLIRVLELTDEGEGDDGAEQTPIARTHAELDELLSMRGKRPAAIAREAEELPTTTIDAGERPQTADDPDPIFLEEACDVAGMLQAEDRIQPYLDEYLGKAQVEAERTAINGYANEARKRLSGGGKKQKQLA